MAKKAAAVATPANGAKPKTKCPLTKDEFVRAAKPISVVVNGVPMAASVKEFSTGSFGWYLNGRTVIEVAGEQVTAQIGMNLTAVGSKPE